MSDRYFLTDHAVEQFIKRARSEDTTLNTDESIRTIMGLLSRSFEVAIDPVYRVKSIINNGFKDAKYRYFNGWVFVIVGNKNVTIFRGRFKKGRILPDRM